MKYTRSSELGLVWAGTTSVRKAYEWDPATLIDGVGERDVHGVEAPLWSETIETRNGPRPPGLPPAPRRGGDRLVAVRTGARGATTEDVSARTALG